MEGDEEAMLGQQQLRQAPGTTKPWAVGRCWWEQRLRGSVTSEAAVSERTDKEARYSRSEAVD